MTMESKEKQKIFAQTYIPSVGYFDNKPGPIQLASKAKDCNSVSLERIKSGLKQATQKKTPHDPSSQLVANIKSPDMSKGEPLSRNLHLVDDKSEKTSPKENENLMKESTTTILQDGRKTDSSSPRVQYESKQCSRFISPKQKCPSPVARSSAQHKEPRNITSISACTWMPETSVGDTAGNDNPRIKEQGNGHIDETRNQVDVSSAELKEGKQSPGFYRSFQVQPGRSAMKLERNRGNHKLPVGIAVARQRLHTTPTKLRGSVKSVSPDSERRHHERALNQEREVLLRENKELSNYTSRLQTSTTTASIPLLNVPNTVLPAWETERALMATSLLQWRAQQSQQLLNSGFQHPMWFGGSPPYIPSNQAGSALPAAATPTSGYPVIGGGIPGGFVIMPQFLESGAAVWPASMTLYGNTHPTSRTLAHSFPSLLSQQFNMQQQQELHALHQQTSLRHELPLLHKGDLQVGIKNHHTSPSPYLRKSDSSGGSRSPSQYRYNSSPKYSRRDNTPNGGQGERPQRTPLRSPPPGLLQYARRKTSGDSAIIENVKIHRTSNSSTPDIRSISQHGVLGGRSTPLSNYTTHDSHGVVPASHAARQSQHILDLSSSPVSNPADSKLTWKNEAPAHFETLRTSNSPSGGAVTSLVLATDNELTHCSPRTPSTSAVIDRVAPKTIKSLSSCKTSYVPEERALNPTYSLRDSTGVELLTKAADIHLKHINSQQETGRDVVDGSHTHPQRLSENVHKITGVQSQKQTSKYAEDYGALATNAQSLTPLPPKTINQSDPIDISTLDPDVLDAVRGITLLSHSSFSQQQQKSAVMPDAVKMVEQRKPPPAQSQSFHADSDDVQSSLFYSSVPDPSFGSADGLSSNELKERDSSCERVRLKRKLNKPISSKLRFNNKEEENTPGVSIKLDSMEAMEVDMKMRLADLQRRYKEKQRELAKLQRKNKTDARQSSSNSITSNTNLSTNVTTAAVTTCAIKSSGFLSVQSNVFRSNTSQKCSSIDPSLNGHEKQIFSHEYLDHSAVEGAHCGSKKRKYFETEKDSFESKVKMSLKQTPEKREKKPKPETQKKNTAHEVTSDAPVNSAMEELDPDVGLDYHQMPSGSRKRKADKPKRICLPLGEPPTVPLVEPAKKNVPPSGVLCKSDDAHFDKSAKGNEDKKRKSKLKQSKKKAKQEGTVAVSETDTAFSSWVFKSSSKSEKHDKKTLHGTKKAEKDKAKHPKSQKKPSNNANLSNNNNKKKKSGSSISEKHPIKTSDLMDVIPEVDVPTEEEGKAPMSEHRLELKEEDLVKGLQVLVPLEDKLLYLCQINPIQPPDIYEVTVEGERHRHRPIVMCLEQILSEAVPDVKPRSSSDLCEGARVAAYWSHKMHCLYTGTISFDDSDCEDEELYTEEMVQVEFDDGDSSMIPLEDIRLLPTSYPIMQPEAPFMMHYINRRRNTSELSSQSKDGTSGNKGTHTKAKKQPDKKDKPEKKSRKKTTKTPVKRKTSLDLSAYDYPSTDDIEQSAPTRKSSLEKGNPKHKKPSTQTTNAAETSSSSVSSADEDSDTLFSDSSDDTYEGDDGDCAPSSRIEEKRLPVKCHRRQSHSNELWTWYDKDVQKKTVKGKAKKIYHKSIGRGDEVISCGDSAVFLSSGRPYLPYIGRIESMWESWGNNMVVKVRWFYHPEETKRGRLKSHGKHPLYKSSHIDENDVQTISHKCEVVSFKEYNRRMRNDERNIFYCTGIYDPATGQVTQEYSDRRKHSKS